MAKIAELFGWRVDEEALLEPHANWLTCNCPFTGKVCDVSANRGDRAYFDPNGPAITDDDRAIYAKHYTATRTPLGICTVSTKRRFEAKSKPWIICPKRMMELHTSPPVMLPEVKALIPIKPGADVRCWWEFKFASSDDSEENELAGRFFEFTFDYILMEVDWSEGGDHPKLIGAPYILEIMTSSTRGGGLTEHMADVLALRDQRSLRGAVKSPYTPNYRQVFGRMASQLFAKSEAAASWGGKTIWILQDVLLEYIQQTTAFRPEPFMDKKDGNVNMVVYRMDENPQTKQYDLAYDKTLVGNSRVDDAAAPDFTSMLGIGHIPSLDLLKSTLERTQSRRRKPGDPVNWIDFTW
ncbi:NotI family restriction endonuclease [Stenotrophomonas acidaminiphila]|uniref:NotI family restriction endonuclease n=1 Tax=Stenotrophomonas acidaminiphila TaxID=128780 RepID=UPI0015F59C06|nr:NotI family restriction endonuclease [Stenotrophomonas acidaminiphila]